MKRVGVGGGAEKSVYTCMYVCVCVCVVGEVLLLVLTSWSWKKIVHVCVGGGGGAFFACTVKPVLNGDARATS